MTRLFEEMQFVSKAVLMMQKEVATKLLAKPSSQNYCMLSVFANTFYTVKKLFTVPPHCFTPQPGVESSVIMFDANKNHEIDAVCSSLYFQVVRAAFARRRKTLENSLLYAGLESSRAAAEEAIINAGIKPGARGESLSVGDFAALTHALLMQ